MSPGGDARPEITSPVLVIIIGDEFEPIAARLKRVGDEGAAAMPLGVVALTSAPDPDTRSDLEGFDAAVLAAAHACISRMTFDRDRAFALRWDVLVLIDHRTRAEQLIDLLRRLDRSTHGSLRVTVYVDASNLCLPISDPSASAAERWLDLLEDVRGVESFDEDASIDVVACHLTGAGNSHGYVVDRPTILALLTRILTTSAVPGVLDWLASHSDIERASDGVPAHFSAVGTSSLWSPTPPWNELAVNVQAFRLASAYLEPLRTTAPSFPAVNMIPSLSHDSLASEIGGLIDRHVRSYLRCPRATVTRRAASLIGRYEAWRRDLAPTVERELAKVLSAHSNAVVEAVDDLGDTLGLGGGLVVFAAQLERLRLACHVSAGRTRRRIDALTARREPLRARLAAVLSAGVAEGLGGPGDEPRSPITGPVVRCLRWWWLRKASPLVRRVLAIEIALVAEEATLKHSRAAHRSIVARQRALEDLRHCLARARESLQELSERALEPPLPTDLQELSFPQVLEWVASVCGSVTAPPPAPLGSYSGGRRRRELLRWHEWDERTLVEQLQSCARTVVERSAGVAAAFARPWESLQRRPPRQDVWSELERLSSPLLPVDGWGVEASSQHGRVLRVVPTRGAPRVPSETQAGRDVCSTARVRHPIVLSTARLPVESLQLRPRPTARSRR